jgi:hypothetical protein
MSSNSGDATIIAGSNNEHMVAVRCDKCQKVELYSQEDYELKKRDDDLRCTHTELCREEDPKGTVMKEISVYDFKCDKCSTVLARSVADESGYLCVSAAPMGRSIMCNTGDKGDRKLYCRKICAMSNCDKLGYGDCPAVEAYRKNKNIGDAALAMMCNSCPNRRSCPEKCRPYVRENAISACSKCSHSLCVPKPHVIDFDERWEAKCPVCGGKIRPVVARTFAAYLRSSWNFTHDEGRAFCGNLLQEAAKVEDIKEVLDADMKD